MTTAPNQAWHTAIVTKLSFWACGDLILDQQGDLHTRDDNDGESCIQLPFKDHKIGEKLATISRAGWWLSVAGATFILENCCPDNRADIRKLEWVAEQGKFERLR